MAQMAEVIAQRVADKLLALQKKALVVYTGSKINFEDSLESLKKLRGEGFTYEVFLSQSAAAILDVSAIREGLAPANLWIGTTDQPPEALATAYHTILVPCLSINTASHIAACMPDSPASRIITNAMWRGKNVVLNIDGCCPDNAFRVAHYRMTEPLKAHLRENLAAMQAYGATLTSAKGLYAKTLKTIGAPSAPAAIPAACGEKTRNQPAAPAAGKTAVGKVVGRGQVTTTPAGGTLRVPTGCLVTSLAREEAVRRNVTIIQE